MRKLISLLYSIVGLCASAVAQQGHVLNMASPKLREFLAENSKALQLLTNTLSEAFSNRTIQVYYFYSDDDSIARASHYYPDESVVGVLIRENQLPFDEFTCLLFEAINSTSEKHFQELFAKAQSGEISKSDFVKEMRQTEFIAIKRTRDALKKIGVAKNVAAKSYFYKRFAESPDSFDDFVVYRQKVASPHRDTTQELEAKYDLLRKAAEK
jgi:hypothetical protein